MGDDRHGELLGLQSELSNAALKAAMETDAPDAVRSAVEAGEKTVRRAVRLNPMAWVAASFLVGVVMGSLLRPVVVGAGRDGR
ncbi:hypothetical protein EZH22_26485 [Xanthobacter dioxanivorans]|uniref:Uncharacterized protein n=1 Tax=Xanthobacter dioxanivorans TaxID=2528964 RepID=A0A974PNG1_9HYPH|nr:hypothetical protein [Xanthobacter dioxanivorans]QRG06451.1 hypothetical protein EZH22_26485 [Xanthobacter dioxanivorans]